MTNLGFVSKSARGLVRKDNQDSLFTRPEAGVFAVADGMGGGAEGARASKIVCAALAKGVSAKAFADRLDQIGAAIDSGNAEIFAYSGAHHFKQMGTTVSLLAFDLESTGRAAIAYIGDSRVYRIRRGAATLLTRDHSVGAELEDRVGGSEGAKLALRSNPLAHILTRAIGTSPKVEIEWRKIDVKAGDRYLVCSDGVHDVVATGELGGLVGSGTLKFAMRSLEAAVLKAGAPDNYSFVLVEVGGAA